MRKSPSQAAAPVKQLNEIRKKQLLKWQASCPGPKLRYGSGVSLVCSCAPQSPIQQHVAPLLLYLIVARHGVGWIHSAAPAQHLL